MLNCKGLLAFALLLLALATPAAAFAQSPGDEQYTDPFQGGNQGGGQQGNQGGGTQGDQGGGTGGGGETPSGTPQAAPPTPAPSGSTAAVPEPSVSGTASSAQLPATGLPAGVPAALGGMLLAGGLALRRGASTCGR